jgi:DNA adenine methylase
LPSNIIKKNFTYIEPFVGSGAVMFWMLNNFPNIKKVVINDINVDLINTYNIIALKPKEIISLLKQLENEFYSLLNNNDAKKKLLL